MVALEPCAAYHRLLAGVAARLENAAQLVTTAGPVAELNRAAELYAAGGRRGPRALAAAIKDCEAAGMYAGTLEGATLADEALAALLAVVLAESSDERGDAPASLHYYTLGFRLMAAKPACLPARVRLNGISHALAETEVSLACDFSGVLSRRCLTDVKPIPEETLAVLRATCADTDRNAAVRRVAHMCLGCAAQVAGGAAAELKRAPGDTSIPLMAFSVADGRLDVIMHHNKAVRDLADAALAACPEPMRRNLRVFIDEARTVASKMAKLEAGKPAIVLLCAE